jgi:predicted O-linked N-acetylglucosamine transferase (SPINDLY family)
MGWQQEAHKHLLEGNYAQVLQYYEQAIQNEPGVVSNYWYLGLAYLLQQQEELAQATWFFTMAQGSDSEIIQWTQQLTKILEVEAQRQASIHDLQNSWLIRQHLREINPKEINNLLQLVLASFDKESFSLDLLEEYKIIDIINDISSDRVDSELLLKVLIKSLDIPSANTLKFLNNSLHCANPVEPWVASLIASAVTIADQIGQPDFATQVLNACLKLDSENLVVFQYLCLFYDKAGNYSKSFKAAEKMFEKSNSTAEKLLSSYLMTEAFIQTNSWIGSYEYIEKYKALMKRVIEENSENIESNLEFSIVATPQLLSYIQDNPCENNWFQNKLSNLFQSKLIPYTPPAPSLIKSKKPRPLRIGYIAHTFRVHSVGWLSRWLFHYHNKESFQTAIYFVNQNSDNAFSNSWFKDKASFYKDLKTNPQEIAAQIQEDEIDILVELDSVTFDATCMVMALKPAPVQITWLGKDASGIPSIDYFMADPYVLPEDAQDYYQETIWRLPQTYIAVDGFEIDVPTLRREHLGIPSDAIVYFTAQNGLKRHPDTVRLQMQVLKEIRNGHLLVKGRSDETSIQRLFIQLAAEEGINPDRLHFLPMDSNEYVHRANLQIADIILDTFPYNGATTTLEALWVGIPLVTKVGKQFAARNSYAFLMNVGVTEGIAWTNEEYVEWGIRLGCDEALRQQVAWKLRQSRHTSPLWNAKQFTRDMEDAYQQMWTHYTHSVGGILP